MHGGADVSRSTEEWKREKVGQYNVVASFAIEIPHKRTERRITPIKIHQGTSDWKDLWDLTTHGVSPDLFWGGWRG